jgi:hypothetical protein
MFITNYQKSYTPFPMRQEDWPYIPLCSNDYENGVYPRPFKQAIKCRYLQANPDKLLRWFTFDIDIPSHPFIHRDLNLPTPTFTALDPQTGHAHIGYLSKLPFVKQDSNTGRLRRPYFLALAFERGVRKKLNLPHSLLQKVIKNPSHQDWNVSYDTELKAYDLAELGDWVEPVFERPTKNEKVDITDDTQLSEGFRNDGSFDKLRFWAYKKTAEFYQFGNKEEMEAFAHRIAVRGDEINVWNFPPLPKNEIFNTCKSIARFCFKHHLTHRTDFLIRQSFCGKRSGQVRGRAAQEKAVIARSLRNDGHSVHQIQLKLEVSRATVFSYLKQKSNEPKSESTPI